jgi:CHRD domain
MRRALFPVAAALAAAGVSTIAMTTSSAGAGPEATTSALPPTAGLFAQLRGVKEVSPAGRRGAGDPDGYGSFSAITPGGNRLCYGYAVFNILKPTAAHIHRGGAGVNGPVVIPLGLSRLGSPGTISGCGPVPAALITQIRTNPGGFYVNVHNGPYPGGAIRGQLFGPFRTQDR